MIKVIAKPSYTETLQAQVTLVGAQGTCGHTLSTPALGPGQGLKPVHTSGLLMPSDLLAASLPEALSTSPPPRPGGPLPASAIRATQKLPSVGRGQELPRHQWQQPQAWG